MKCSELIRLLKSDGWMVNSQKGSHIKMKHPVKKGIVIVPNHGSKEVATGTAFQILKAAGLSGHLNK
jgi:predicted RNA binding protein YcfA (HicA-like mRNA interferase family)